MLINLKNSIVLFIPTPKLMKTLMMSDKFKWRMFCSLYCIKIPLFVFMPFIGHSLKIVKQHSVWTTDLTVGTDKCSITLQDLAF